MKTRVCCTIRNKLNIIVIVSIVYRFFILFSRHLKAVCINKYICSCIIGWINENHLHLAEIAFLQELEDFQIIALDVEVFGGVPILALRHTGAQRLPDRLVGFYDSRLLADPCELVCLVAVHHVRREHLFQQLKVDRPLVHLLLRRAVFLVQHLCDAVRKQGSNAVYILCRHIWRFHA